ncbi:free fatty acid receptor 2-like [Anguilla anguilla]|uniref:free fatty acid receptor 2-like n=1 Tax=Anguilla anguilla TaxID=7936 RepID=UPI0015AD7C3D|nr:free fatty acid receptor 2-like [Anguilla anguilla]XP_035246029.1 free fatty acid receptor 2-like [Anguilla anguilla]
MEKTEHRPHRDLVLGVYIVTFVAGVPANLLALVAFTRKVRQKATPIDILLLNLTVSDLIFLAFLPFKMKEAADDMQWNMPYFLCPLSGFLFYATIYNSTFFLTAVSVERYLGVAFPIKYKLKRRPAYAVVASVVFWVVSLGHCSIVYIMQYFEHGNSSQPAPQERSTCYVEFTPAQLEVLLPVRLELFLVLFCIPFLVCSFCYVNFIRILCRLPNISLPKRQRAIGMALGTLLVFALCFGPYNVSHVVGFASRESPPWRVYALLFSTFNACLDPLIFYFSSSAVRGMLRSVLRGAAGRLRPSCAGDKARCYPHMVCTATEESTQCSNETS